MTINFKEHNNFNLLLALTIIKEFGKIEGYTLAKVYNERIIEGYPHVNEERMRLFLIECRVYDLVERVECHSEADPVYEWRG